jgi:hypothetical protein
MQFRDAMEMQQNMRLSPNLKHLNQQVIALKDNITNEVNYAITSRQFGARSNSLAFASAKK